MAESRPQELEALAKRMPVLVLGLGAFVFVAIKLAVLTDDFPNPDIAGIVYNAELWLDGGLPYRDSVEIKPPGAFAITAVSFAMLGRSLVAWQWFHALWLLLGAPAIAIAARGDGPRLSGRVAIAVAVYLLYAPMFTFNYSSWMLPLYAWSFAAMVRSLKRPSRSWAFLAGLSAVGAFLVIQRAAVLGPIALGVWWLGHRRKAAGATPASLAWQAVGGLAGLGLAAIPFIVAGETGAFFDAALPLETAAEYSSASGWGMSSVLGAVPQLVSTFGVATGLIALGLVARWLDREAAPADPIRGAAAILLLGSVVGTGLGGGRFYLHYLVQDLPALAVLAADPGLLAMLRRSSKTARVITLLAIGCLVAAVLEVSLGHADRFEAKVRRLQSGQTASQAAGAHIRALSSPDDVVFGWGWTAWRVYYWAQRRAPAGFYKPLGTLTTFNTNTAFSADSAGPQFRPGPAADRFIEAFDAKPPAFVVLSPSFTAAFGSSPDPLQDFTALRTRLERDYQPDAQFGDLVVLRRVEP